MSYFKVKNMFSFGSEKKCIHREGRNSKSKWTQGGFTLVETLVTVVLLSGMLIGFRYILLGYWEQINRSWAERYMEQYGNSVVEYVARNIKNAIRIEIPENSGILGTFTVYFADSLAASGERGVQYSSEAEEGIFEDDEKIIWDFPPPNFDSRSKSILGPRELFELVEFRIDSIYHPEPPFYNQAEFKERLMEITLKIRYIKQNDAAQSKNYIRQMTFSRQVSMLMASLWKKENPVNP